MKIQVTVKPNCPQQNISEFDDGSLMIYLKSSPIKGKANQELNKILAKKYGVTLSQILIKRGRSAITN
jgi:uncharacterized protein YggU (UPF0235/DUF167 family)